MNLFPSSVEINSFRQESDSPAPVTGEPSDFAPLVWERPVYFLFSSRFHFLVLLGPFTLLKDRLERGNRDGELSGHTRGTQGVSACVERDEGAPFLPFNGQ